MEVKSVYMDLNEGVKKGNVWKLESEAFKKPIEIKIWYDNYELKQFTETCEALDKKIHDQEEKLSLMKYDQTRLFDMREEFQNKNNNKQYQIDELRDKIAWMAEEINQLYKAVADVRNARDAANWAILQLQTDVKAISKKITKQPMVIHDKCFISWRESSGLWMIELKDGDYLMIMNIKIWEHNEYVENKDELIMEKIHVEGQHYVPFYKLEWGTELDTPTATIYYDLIFMPI